MRPVRAVLAGVLMAAGTTAGAAPASCLGPTRPTEWHIARLREWLE